MKLTFDALKAGAVGVDMGRNIWQSDNPVAMIKAVHSIVHGSNNAEQAFTLYKQLSGKSNQNQNNKPKNKSNQNQNNKPKNKSNQNQNNKPKKNFNKKSKKRN